MAQPRQRYTRQFRHALLGFDDRQPPDGLMVIG
jgi:hypothetical protein